MKGFNFEFGKCPRARMSPYGLAVQNSKKEWVSYDPSKGEIMNVDILNFDAGSFTYKMPVPIKSLKEGDCIVHNNHFMYVSSIIDNTVCCIDVAEGEIKMILPQKSPFGFDFVTKITCLLDFAGFSKEADEDNPFGNMWMLAFMGEDGFDNNMLLPMMMMQNGGNFGEGMNPMMFALLANQNGGGADGNLLPMMMMMMNMNK